MTLKHEEKETPALVSPSPGHNLTVRVLKSEDDVLEIRDICAAWRGHRDSDIDLCLKVVWSWEEVVRPHVIVLYRGGILDAMLIGRLERIRIDSRVGYLRIPGLSATVLSFPYGGLRGNDCEENCVEFIRSVLMSLKNDEADLAFLHLARVDSPLYKVATTLPGVGARDYVSKAADHHFTTLPETLDQLLQGLSSKHRKHLRSEAKKLQSDFDGRVTVRCFRHPDELDEAIRQVTQIAERTYQKGLGVGFEDTPKARQLLQFFAESGWLMIHILYLADKPCAFAIGSASEGVYCCDFLGFDPGFGQYSPGSFLLTHLFDDLCKAGVKEVDFGAGEALYKQRFGNRRTREASVYIFAPDLKGISLNVVRTGTSSIDSGLKKILNRTNLLPRIKRLWRGRLTKRVTTQQSAIDPK